MIIREKDRETLIDITSKSLKSPSLLMAFGSRVNGEAHDRSDLDLVIKSKDNKPIDRDEFMNLKKNLRESNIPIVIQLIDWYRVPIGFHKNILEKYEEVLDIG
jgi:predicted nucleotidyltransferase